MQNNAAFISLLFFCEAGKYKVIVRQVLILLSENVNIILLLCVLEIN